MTNGKPSQNLPFYFRWLTKADVILIVAITASCILVFVGMKFIKSKGSVVEISAKGRVIIEHNLVQDATLEVQGPLGKTIVQVANQQVRILSSPCKDHICMQMGTIDARGGVLICVPNEVVVTIASGKNDVLDAVTR